MNNPKDLWLLAMARCLAAMSVQRSTRARPQNSIITLIMIMMVVMMMMMMITRVSY